MVRRRIRTDGFVDPCVPTLAAEPPSGPDWIHEIEHDDYRLIVRRAARPCRSLPCAAKSFTLDGEAVPVGADGVAIFDALHRRHKATDAMLYAFDLLELNGKDQRPLPLGERKAKLVKLLARAPSSIVFNEHPAPSD